MNSYRQLIAHDADAVFGPVVHEFENLPPDWLLDIGFFHYWVPRTGSVLLWHQTRTSNVLVRTKAIKSWPIPFNPDFGLEGGGDVDLFSRMIDQGYRLIAVDNAVVHEIVPRNRMTLSWLARRYFRNGLTTQRIVGPKTSGLERWARLPNSFAAVVRGALLGSAILPFSRGKGAKCFLNAVFHLGVISQFLGVGYKEYA